ncbi:hypothetical protein BV22DRAFT_1002926 [Leucogyrophana mollusca]|uniref:Uncharacterized protein n=1 Tax=Leucogyrophana mollusca TaxID=85980 RepID=A0ACB8BXH6_9AGAM|nr:hypothetical protein BV22DRAFT_1002926 [Leucogyrophana mollusca]
MSTLEVLNFHPEKVMAHPRVLAWHDDIERENENDLDDFDMDDDDVVEAYWS